MDNSDVLTGSKPVLIDFWAPWCMPCRKLSPTIDEIKKQYSNDIEVLKVNIDLDQSLCLEYNINSVPTLLLLKEGNVEDVIIGLVTKEKIEDSIRKVL